MLATRLLLASVMLLGSGFCVTRAAAQDRSIDTTHSVLKIRVFKSGVFSAFAHDHEIEAPIADGTVHLAANPSVVVRVHGRELRVLDPDVSSGQRAEIQGTMEGPQILDIKRFPEISFQSTAVQRKDDQHWVVRGNLTLHGHTAALEVGVVFKDNHYRGFAQLRQHDFGMTPVSIAGGTVKVKDEVRIEFDIVLKP
jgi:polyisoprenoid-binding protein YceI